MYYSFLICHGVKIGVNVDVLNKLLENQCDAFVFLMIFLRVVYLQYTFFTGRKEDKRSVDMLDKYI